MIPRRTKHSKISAAELFLLFVASLFLFSCSGGLFSTPIGKIQASPRDFDGKQVTLKGTVTESANVIFMKYFMLKDNTGEIHVITERILPRQGEAVTVKGKVQEAFAVGDQRLIVVVESPQ